MLFEKTGIEGAYLITRTPNYDERGSFARFYCEQEFKQAGIEESFVQMNICTNKKRGTLRGLHYQSENAAEDKVVSCIKGRIFDVCVDIRSSSETFLRYAAYELSEDNNKMLYIPKGCAHGYVTLEDDSSLLYMMTEFYVPNASFGYRYDDDAFGIEWPITSNLIISEKDRNLPKIFNEKRDESKKE